MTEIDFSKSKLRTKSISALVNFVPSDLLKLNLSGLRINDRNLEKLVKRCKKIIELDLGSTLITLKGMTIRVVEFSNGGYKIRNIFGLRINVLKRLLNLENWVNGEVSKSAKI